MADLTEYQKMLAGERFRATDPEISAKLSKAADKQQAYNSLPSNDMPALIEALGNILAPGSGPAFIKPPFYFEFGDHIELGMQVFLNMNCTLLDSGPIKIGSFTAIGPNCQLITVTHPTPFEERLVPEPFGPFPRQPVAYTRAITIGEKCWLGAGVTVLPGVTIGSGAVIGAGSVVTKDVPENMVAAGVPCRLIRPVED